MVYDINTWRHQLHKPVLKGWNMELEMSQSQTDTSCCRYERSILRPYDRILTYSTLIQLFQIRFDNSRDTSASTFKLFWLFKTQDLRISDIYMTEDLYRSIRSIMKNLRHFLGNDVCGMLPVMTFVYRGSTNALNQNHRHSKL
jgi:hypothetical protein